MLVLLHDPTLDLVVIKLCELRRLQAVRKLGKPEAG
jgi:hypothetical protein